MWRVVFGRNWVYLKDVELTYASKSWSKAASVYCFWYFRYVLSMHPVKYIKMYQVEDNVIPLRNYKSDSNLKGIKNE